MSIKKTLIVVLLVLGALIVTKACMAADISPDLQEPLTLRELSEGEKLKLFLYEQVDHDWKRFTEIKKVIDKESEWNPSVQSYCMNNGVREESFGLVQIHLPSHPEITKEQALDPYFSIKFIVERFNKGYEEDWTAYRVLKMKGAI